MSSGVEARIALDVAVVLSLGTNRLLGSAGKLTAAGAEALAALAEGRAEKRAAALAEVERQHQALQQVIERLARLAVLAEAAERHGADVVLPQALDVQGLTPEDLAAWCEQADPLLEAAERGISERIASSVEAQAFAGFASTEPTELASTESKERPEPGRESRAGRRAALARVVGRLLPDTAEADVRHVAAAAERLGTARTEAEAESLLSEVRLRVQQANRRTAERQAEQARRTAEADAAEQAAAERAYVLDAVTTAFGDIGYEVEAGFETLTASDGTVILTRDGWPDHAVKLKIDEPKTLRAALVRTEEPHSEEDRRRDVEREEEWCAAFEAARRRLAGAGVASDVRWQLDPGEHRLPVAREARQTRKARRERTRQQEREHGGGGA
jgi:hypothetical protein